MKADKPRYQYGAKTEHGDKYILDFTAEHLPNVGMFISDVDLVIRQKDGSICLVEIKRFMSVMKPNQRNTYNILQFLLSAGATALNGKCEINGQTFKVNVKPPILLTFERTTFEDGRAYIGNLEVSKAEAAQILSFEKTAEQIRQERKGIRAA